MCVGIDLCSRKNCIEQERCLFPTRPGKKDRINKCQVNKKFCSNAKSCEILGQCILDHPLVKNDKLALRQLRKPLDINGVVKIISKLMPPLNRIGLRRFYKPDKLK